MALFLSHDLDVQKTVCLSLVNLLVKNTGKLRLQVKSPGRSLLGFTDACAGDPVIFSVQRVGH